MKIIYVNALFITTSDYTKRAYAYAKNVGWLELWTMKDILNAMNKINKQWIVLYDIKEQVSTITYN